MALTLLAAALFFVWHAAVLPFGEIGLPGPGFFPFALGIALGLLALALLGILWRTSIGLGETVFLGHRDVLLTLAGLAGAAFAFERLGAFVTLGVFAAFLLYFVARSALWRVLAGASLGMVAIWLFFGVALGVRLPAGQVWSQLLESTAPAAELPSDEPAEEQPEQSERSGQSSDQPSGQQ